MDPSALEVANHNNNTPIHSAVLAGNFEVVEFLLETAKAKIEPGITKTNSIVIDEVR
jgi:ankyrin repeat protein